MRVIRAINILRASVGVADVEKGNVDEKMGVMLFLSKFLGVLCGGLSLFEFEFDVLWIEFIFEKVRASVLIGWFMYVLDEVKVVEYDEFGL